MSFVNYGFLDKYRNHFVRRRLITSVVGPGSFPFSALTVPAVKFPLEHGPLEIDRKIRFRYPTYAPTARLRSSSGKSRRVVVVAVAKRESPLVVSPLLLVLAQRQHRTS